MRVLPSKLRVRFRAVWIFTFKLDLENRLVINTIMVKVFIHLRKSDTIRCTQGMGRPTLHIILGMLVIRQLTPRLQLHQLLLVRHFQCLILTLDFQD